MLDKLNEKWFKVNEWKYGHLLTKQYGTSLNVSKIILNVSITLPLNFLSVWTIFKSLNITWISFQCNSITLAFTEMYLISLYFFLSFKTIVSKSCYWQILVQRLLTANLFWESALKKKEFQVFLASLNCILWFTVVARQHGSRDSCWISQNKRALYFTFRTVVLD